MNIMDNNITSRKAQTERKPSRKLSQSSTGLDSLLSFSPAAEEGLRNRLSPGQFDLFESAHFQVDVAHIALLDQLAKGSYGVVYRCCLNGSSYAVKIEDFLPGVEEQVNLLVELTILQSLPHDRLVPFFGAGYLSKSSAGAYKVMIVMELCSHGALREGLRYPLPWSLRVRLALDTAMGLAFLHENNIIHRDIKTTNVLIDDNWRAKLCDFSFACHANCSAKRAFIYGTDEFMSPEIAMGDDFDTSSDIFSLGILLCEVITGREPSAHFLHREAKNLFEMNEQELKAAIPLDCPESLEALVMQCCALTPSDRPTAQECVDWLQAVLEELGGDDIDLMSTSLSLTNISPEREGHVKYPKTQDLSFIRNAKAVRDGSDSISRLAFLEVQIQELRAENRRLNREMNSVMQTRRVEHEKSRLSVSGDINHNGSNEFPSAHLNMNNVNMTPSSPYVDMSPAQLRASSSSLSELLSSMRDRIGILERKVDTLIVVPSTTATATSRLSDGSSTSGDAMLDRRLSSTSYDEKSDAGEEINAQITRMQRQLAELTRPATTTIGKMDSNTHTSTSKSIYASPVSRNFPHALRHNNNTNNSNSSNDPYRMMDQEYPLQTSSPLTISTSMPTAAGGAAGATSTAHLSDMSQLERSMRFHVDSFAALLQQSIQQQHVKHPETVHDATTEMLATSSSMPATTTDPGAMNQLSASLQSFLNVVDTCAMKVEGTPVKTRHTRYSLSDMKAAHTSRRLSSVSTSSSTPDADGIMATWRDVDGESESGDHEYINGNGVASIAIGGDGGGGGSERLSHAPPPPLSVHSVMTFSGKRGTTPLIPTVVEEDDERSVGDAAIRIPFEEEDSDK
eukprot:gene8495-17522_t